MSQDLAYTHTPAHHRAMARLHGACAKEDIARVRPDLISAKLAAHHALCAIGDHVSLLRERIDRIDCAIAARELQIESLRQDLKQARALLAEVEP